MKKQVSLGISLLMASYGAFGFNFEEIQNTVKQYEEKRLEYAAKDNQKTEELEKTLSYLLDSLKHQYIRQIELALAKMELNGLDEISNFELKKLVHESDQLLHTLENYSQAIVLISKAEKLTQLTMETTVLLPEKYGVKHIQQRLIRNMSYLQTYQIQ